VYKKQSLSLATKLGLIGGLLLLMALASIGLTLWVTWQLQGGAAAVNEAGRLRMQTWRLAQSLSGGDQSRVPDYIAGFDSALDLLFHGDPARPLFVPHDASSRDALANVQQKWQALRGPWSSNSPPPPNVLAAQAGDFAGQIDVFVTAVERQIEYWMALLNTFQFLITAMVVASAVTLIYAAYVFVLSPLSLLQTGVGRIQEGDLSARVRVQGDDEFGTLAAEFNQMAQTLQAFYQDLEARVEEKTLGLETERERLAALYEAAAFSANATSLEQLAQGYARQMRQVAHADAAAVRWSDELNQHYLLLASDGWPQDMAAAEHCVPAGDCFCGQPRGEAQTRVIPIATAQQPLRRLGHCERAGFEFLVSVPVRLHERVAGEIDLFYRKEPALGAEDHALLEALASHLAGAIENLRVSALELEAAVAEERGLLARELHDSIAQSLSFLRIQAGLLRDALQRKNTAAADASLGELDAGIRESLADVRELLVHFRTRTNIEDIVPALRTTLTKFEHQTGLQTHLSVEGEGLPLPADVQVQVLHVVQEALSNVRKHAHAQQVWIEVQKEPVWRFEVRDDGQGFDVNRPIGDETHVGLRIMRERAQSIGAVVEAVSVLGSGTCVILTLPAHTVEQPSETSSS